MLAAIYLVFNAGYGPPVRQELCAEAIRLALLLATLMPDEAEVHGLHALVLLQDARRDARVSPEGRLVLPVGLGWAPDPGFANVGEPTDIKHRAERLDEGLALIDALWHGEEVSLRGKHFSVEHLRMHPRPYQRPRIPIWVVAGWKSRRSIARAARWDGAVAVAMARGEVEGLALVDAIDGLDDYYLLYAARADLLRRLGRGGEAAAAYERALALAPSEVERGFLRARLLEGADGDT